MSKMEKFLWYSYFGITAEDAQKNNEEALEKCIQRAYRDLCRTLNYSKSESALKEQNKEYAKQYRNSKGDFIEEENKYIAKSINNLFDKKLGFDDWHKATCKEIIKKAKSLKVENDDLFLGFSYGQAQKWLNMTLKYMLLMELWDEPMQKIEGNEEHLHIPVDAYVIEAVEKYVEPSEEEKWECLNSSKANYEKSWSKWEFEQYDEFQKKMRKHIEEQKDEEKQKYSTPMNWEQEKWIEIAKEKN